MPRRDFLSLKTLALSIYPVRSLPLQDISTYGMIYFIKIQVRNRFYTNLTTFI